MSRSQKPGKIKLIAGTPRHDRRISDRMPAETASILREDSTAAASNSGQPNSVNRILALSFLAACAVGGAGTAYLAFAGKLPG